ncbi:MAG: 30S ribosomal protein S9 [Candidatus Wildermuthbacteria bacterium]|nr:30S ribosomal protein S9 [Candidatus Wildermuthbacteria bacterium]
MPKTKENPPTGGAKYIEAIGRRKTAIARVRITPGAGSAFSVNEKPLGTYFQIPEHKGICQEVFTKVSELPTFAITVKVSGAGLSSQAEAIRHGLARALVEWNPELRHLFGKFGYLKRDPRMRERKKFGLRRARRAPQWSKR